MPARVKFRIFKRIFIFFALLIFIFLAFFILSRKGVSYDKEENNLNYQIRNVYPHDFDAFTQGLIFRQGHLYESTGLYGQSSLREIEPANGSIIQQRKLENIYFGEGITELDGNIYQLTWKAKKGFVYDLNSFELLGEFKLSGEGWGLTNDSRSLILSDGSSNLYFISPITFQIEKQIEVKDRGQHIRNLNELEYIDGKIWANVWHTNKIVIISPETGKVDEWLDFEDLLTAEEKDSTGDFNGIAYDKETGKIYVTGKNWPKIFEIELE